MSRVAIVRYCGECGGPIDDRARCPECGHPADPVVHFTAADDATRPFGIGAAADATSDTRVLDEPPRKRRRRTGRATLLALAVLGVVAAAFVVVAALDPQRPEPRLTRDSPSAELELPPGLAALVPPVTEPRTAGAESPTTAPPATTMPPTTTVPAPTTTSSVATTAPTTTVPPTTRPPAAAPAPPTTVAPATTPTTLASEPEPGAQGEGAGAVGP